MSSVNNSWSPSWTKCWKKKKLFHEIMVTSNLYVLPLFNICNEQIQIYHARDSEASTQSENSTRHETNLLKFAWNKIQRLLNCYEWAYFLISYYAMLLSVFSMFSSSRWPCQKFLIQILKWRGNPELYGSKSSHISIVDDLLVHSLRNAH